MADAPENQENTASVVGRFLGAPLSPEERREVVDALFVSGRSQYRRMTVLTVVSTVIAACGLLADSAAVVIGAMLVAPLMRPVMAAAAAISLGRAKSFRTSLLQVLVMATAAVAMSFGIALLSPDFLAIPEQVLARTVPTFFDLVIALAAGVAGAYTLTRREATAVPGVAIAVALLPPLASTGILLDFGEYALAQRAFVLFVLNLVSMVLAGAITFLATGISSAFLVERFAGFIQYSLLLFVGLILGICVPLYYYSHDIWFDANYQAAHSEPLQAWLAENQLGLGNVNIDVDDKVLTLELVGAEPPLSIEGLWKRYEETQGAEAVEGWTLRTSWTREVRHQWPPPERTEDAGVAPADGELAGTTWSWKATQYGDQEWSGLDKAGDYRVRLTKAGLVRATIDCAEAVGPYLLEGNYLSVELEPVEFEACAEAELASAFFTDLNRVINFHIQDGDLVLRLDNDAGIMHFEAAGAFAD